MTVYHFFCILNNTIYVRDKVTENNRDSEYNKKELINQC
jgi:hypothetical protein